MRVDCLRARPGRLGRLGLMLAALFCGAVAYGGPGGAAEAQIGPQSVGLIDRLCAQTLRVNEEDRLYGMISLAVRATISYRGGEFQRNLIDDAVQNSLDTLMGDCPRLTAADPAKRVDMAMDIISDATTGLLDRVAAARKRGDKNSPYLKNSPGKVTAADLSEQLSSQEVDQWLDSMPPRERALSLFLYASNVTPKDVAQAVGEPPGAISRQLAAGKADLMHIYDENWEEPLSGPGAEPPIKYTESGEGFAALMRATEPPAAPSPTAPPPAVSPTDPAAKADDKPPGDQQPAVTSAAATTSNNGLGSLKVTGISDMLYAGWSLIATTQGLPRGQHIAVTQPFLLLPNSPGIKRMVVTNLAEIGDPNAETRRFLLKAYAIDSSKDAAGIHDTFRVGPPLDNAEAEKTLANPNLTSIEVAHCLWHDFGNAPDPGLCRQKAAAVPVAASAPSSAAAAPATVPASPPVAPSAPSPPAPAAAPAPVPAASGNPAPSP